MRVLVQRSKDSSVKVSDKIVGKIKYGMVILVSFTYGDTVINIDKMINKIVNLRIFDDETGIMNKNIKETGGEILSISQFTLYGDTTKGNRPSYVKSLNKEEAEGLYNIFNDKLREFVVVETGIFHTEMEVNIKNDGPVTIMLEV